MITCYQLVQALQRFPATIISCLLFCGFGIYTSHIPGLSYVECTLLTLFLASVWFSVSQLFLEGMQEQRRLCGYLIAVIIFALPASYLYSLTANLFSHFLLFAIGMITLVPIAPFIGRTAENDRIFCFSFALARQILFSLLVCAIIMGGLMAITFSINILFDNKSERLLADSIFITGSVVFSLLTLSGVPKDFTRDDLPFGAHFVQALIGYVLIPLLMFYGAILYWYFIVLCMMQTLPKGVIVYMAAGFGGLGILADLALDHSKAYHMATIALFRSHFFKFLWVPLFLMGLAIGIRIYEYGLSPQRFIVVMVLLWFVLISVTKLVYNMKYRSRFIYISAACIMLFTVFAIRLL